MSEVIAGISVDGRERDTSLELDMGLLWPSDLEGAGACKPVSYLPTDGSLDSMTGDFTIWLKGTPSAAMEGMGSTDSTMAMLSASDSSRRIGFVFVHFFICIVPFLGYSSGFRFRE